MLDPDILREKPQEVRRMLEKRSVEFDIDGFGIMLLYVMRETKLAR